MSHNSDNEVLETRPDGITMRMGRVVVAIRDPLGYQYFEDVAVFLNRWVNGQAILTNP
jgi:hypothetical protein